MKLLTNAQREQLLANGRAQRAAIDAGTDALDFNPVVKFFIPDAQATWFLTELTRTIPNWLSDSAIWGSGNRNSATFTSPNWLPSAASSACPSSAICTLRPT